MLHDLVYLVKNRPGDDSLRYSLRSVERFFPYGRVWVYGGKPPGIEPDRFVSFKQFGSTKWERTTGMLKVVCQNDEVSDRFWLFNDDFFVMREPDELGPFHGGNLYDRVRAVELRSGGVTNYSKRLRETADELRRRGMTTVNYALHVPMLIDRAKALETFKAFPGFPMFRSLYGNQHKIGGIQIEDVKCYQIGQEAPDLAFLSTSDDVFNRGLVGAMIRDRFRERCKWEK